MNSVLPLTARNADTGFLSWVQDRGTAVGILAEMLSAGLNANVGGRDQLPHQVESQVTDWMRTCSTSPQPRAGSQSPVRR
jgi:aromatic-L-amino-acid/L-tryptophan decarboxylase